MFGCAVSARKGALLALVRAITAVTATAADNDYGIGFRRGRRKEVADRLGESLKKPLGLVYGRSGAAFNGVAVFALVAATGAFIFSIGGT